MEEKNDAMGNGQPSHGPLTNGDAGEKVHVANDHPAPPYSQAVGSAEPTHYVKPQMRKTHDPDVTFEEYHYYANKTREEEKALAKPRTNWAALLSKKKNDDNTAGPSEADVAAAHMPSAQELADRSNRLDITDEEWTNASRAFRSASGAACFYLITTDVLGPFPVAFSLGTMGWGPGIAFYTIFGFFAGYSGYLVWRVFMGVDSYEFPARNYGDLAFRTWGTPFRHITNVLQAVALLLLLGQVTILFGQNISEMSKFRLCYVVCPVIFVVVGFCLTQIRTLKAYGWVATLAIWLNLLTIFITMGVIAHSPPNYGVAELGSAGSSVDPSTITPDAEGNFPPIIHYSGLPGGGLIGPINGLLSGVLAYAGIQLYVEFMAEMRRPRDFLKAMWGAQLFIYTVYLVYGCFVYFYQGQYSYNPSYQGVSTYGWQTVGNTLTLIAGLIAAGLYGNIGVKVVYNNVLMDIFNAPPLVTRTGKFLYAAIVPVWWSIAFVIAASIPDYFGFVSVMSASTLLNLTYTLPPLFALGFDVQRHATRSELGEGFDPNTGKVTRGGAMVARWRRGFFTGGWFQVTLNTWHIIYSLASLSMCGLGLYAGIVGMIDAFKKPQLNAFSCVSPLNLNG